MKSERGLRLFHGAEGLLFVEPLGPRGGLINPGDFSETGVPQRFPHFLLGQKKADLRGTRPRNREYECSFIHCGHVVHREAAARLERPMNTGIKLRALSDVHCDVLRPSKVETVVLKLEV